MPKLAFALVAFLSGAHVAAQVPKPPSSIAIDGELPPVPTLTELLFDDGLEGAIPLLDADITNLLYRRMSDGMGITETSTAHKREGARSMHVQLAKNSILNFRQELRIKSPADDLPIEGSPDYWFGGSIYIPANSSLTSDTVLTQWHTHNPTSGHSPLLGLRIQNGHWKITREATGFQSDILDSVEMNVWTDWVYHIRWRADATGLIDIWKNGELVYHKEKVQTAWEGEPNQPYIQFGRYTSSWKQSGNGDVDGTSQESWYDSLRVCQTAKCSYEDVASRGDRLLAK